MDSADPTRAPALPDPAAPAVPLAEGAWLGRFQVRWLAGQGGMGDVYQAWDSLLERPVALKALKAGDEGAATYLERFRREARALAQMNHPNVCQVYDLITVGDENYIALEWLEGQTLDEAARKMDRRTRLRAVLDVAEGLAAAHAKDLVHRDLKPGNVMVGPDGRARILDFGLAHLGGTAPLLPGQPGAAAVSSPGMSFLESLTEGDLSTQCAPDGAASIASGRTSSDGRLTAVGSFVGSPRYASPEQIRGEVVGPESDIWSLGIVLWELLLGSHPFPGQGVDHMRAVVAGRRHGLKGKGLSRRMAALLDSMLSLKAAQRPTALRVASELGRELEPRRNAIWAAALCATALLAGGGAYLAFGRGVAADLTRRSPARLAIFPMANRTGQERVEGMARVVVPEFIGAGLRDTERLALVDLPELNRTAARLRIDLSGGWTPDAMARVARATGARLYLSGDLENRGGGVALHYQLRDLGGRLRRDRTVEGQGGLETACAQAAERAAGDLAAAVDPLGARSAAPLPVLDAQDLEQYGKATLLLERGDAKAAEPLLRALAYRRPFYTPAILFLGDCLVKLPGQSPAPVLHWARMAAKAQGDREAEARALSDLAVCYEAGGAWEQAVLTVQEGLAVAEPLHRPLVRGRLHSLLGTFHQSRNRLDDAERAYGRALEELTREGDLQAISRLQHNMAVLEKDRGRPEQAQVRYLAALENTRRSGDRVLEGVLLNNLGELALLRQRLGEAEQWLRQALDLRGAMNDGRGLCYVHVNLGGLAQARGQLDLALQEEGLALDLARQLNLRPMEGLCIYNLGEIRRDQGRFQEALGLYRNALALHKAMADPPMQAVCLAGAAECLAREGRSGLAEARALLRQADALNPERSAYLLRARAWCDRSAGRLEEAREGFQQALREARLHAPELVRELTGALAALSQTLPRHP